VGLPTPIDRDFYVRVRQRLGALAEANSLRLSNLEGVSIAVAAGSAITLRLLEGPQIVNVLAFNQRDSDERIWHQGFLREGLFLRTFSRVWGSMARYRPLLTVLEDTVAVRPTPFPNPQHHPQFGGAGTPAAWQVAGGAPGVRSTWEQFADACDELGISSHLIKDNLCLFQKSYIDRESQRVRILPSDALAGDRIVLFAEIDLTLVFALSPLIDGARAASTPGVPEPRAVQVSVSEPAAEPLGWPYAGIPYPDLSLYNDDATGSRSDVPERTRGL
jgi:uncharacterized protein YcgI (DUF1989 family)